MMRFILAFSLIFCFGFCSTPEPDSSLVNLELEDLSGNQVKSGDLSGKPLILHFWATWCKPCIKEMSLLEKSRLSHSEVNIVLISDEDSADIQKFIDNQSYGFKYLRSVNELDNIPARPATYFYNRHGQLISKKDRCSYRGRIE